MPSFGAHKSIAGGYHNAIDAATRDACASVQLFTKNNSQWRGKPISAEEATRFRQAFAASGLHCALAHDSYLINLASPDKTLYRRSIDAFADEIERAELLGLDYLVTHPGCPTDGDEERGLDRIVRALDDVLARAPKARVQVLLETTAGQGCSLGHRFEHLASILERVRRPERLGVCVDTCHIFAAGYPLAPLQAYRRTFRDFDRTVGLDLLKAFHVNDSKKPLGSRVDRHAHIGAGELGLEPFRLLVNDRRFRNHPMILETPKEGPNDEDMDPINLRTLQNLVGSPKRKTASA
ncbi:MAG: deoxyribonuclease IV [Gemmataceae bacterium]